MARKASGKSQGGKDVKQIMKPKVSVLESQALRTCSMDELLGVEALDFGLGIGEILTPKTYVQHLKQQSEVRHTFNEWRQCIHRSGDVMVANKGESRTPIPVLHPANNSASHSIEHIVVDSENESRKEKVVMELVKIDRKDIQDEISFWKSSIICYVLGANPPIQVMERFFRRT